jgi:hypothetical protein
MRNLLYLYNDGHRAFPQLGRGGLGYKPPFKIIGDGLHLVFNPETKKYESIDDLDYSDTKVYDIYYGSTKHADAMLKRSDNLLLERKRKNEERKTLAERLGIDKARAERFGIDKVDENEADNDYETDSEYESSDEEAESEAEVEAEVKAEVKTEPEAEAEPEAETEAEAEPEATKAINFLNTKTYKDIKSAKTRVNAINKKLEKAKTLTEYDKKLLIKIKADEEAHAIIEAEEKAKTKKDPVFTIPEQEDLVQYDPEIINDVLTTGLEDIAGYTDTVKELNALNNIKNVYTSIIDPLESQGDDTYGDTFSLGYKIQKKFNGKDFEQKLGTNLEAMDELLKQSLGDNVIMKKIIEPTSKWSKADFIAKIKQVKGEETVTSAIDIEFKKINKDKYNDYNTTEIINRQTKLYFDKWYVDFRAKLIVASDNAAYGITNPYITLLESISTNGKLDKHKMKLEHIKSGKYFGLPLSFPKFKTPDETTLLNIMQEKYPTQAEKITKFIRKGKRKNESINRLVPVYNAKDAILITSITESLGSNEPFKILNIVNNMYSGSTPNALSVPACLLKTLKLSKNIIDKSKKIDISKYEKNIGI